MAQCPRCQQQLPDPHPAFCPQCGAAVLGLPQDAPASPDPLPPPAPGVDPPPPPPPASSVHAGAGTPWQRRDQLGLIPAFVETARDALFSPAEFFRSMSHGRGIAEAAVYGVAVGWLGQLVASFYQFILHSVVGSSFAGDDQIPEAFRVVMTQFEGIGGFVFSALFGWFFVAVGLFIWSGLVHLALLATGGAKRDFEASFSVACYSESALLWNVVPFCGGVVAVVHWLVVNTIGLSEAHGISRGQALVAVLVPLLLCCCCIPGLGVLLAGSLGALIAGAS